jgi:hypothetical protein
MVSPLLDVQASCQSCHPNDLMDRAQVYAAVLGVEIGGAGSSPLAPTTVSDDQASLIATPEEGDATSDEQNAVLAASEQGTDCPVIDAHLVVDDPNLVDYVQRYNEIVLGEHPVNWGNITLAGLITVVVVGGGGFVVFNEVRLSRRETVKVEGEYPADVVDMLPALVNLKPKTRQSLKNILNKPEKTDKVVGLIDAVVSDEETEGER